MARVLGVGGIFFRSENREVLAAWYEKWLGFEFVAPAVSCFQPATMPAGGYTVWSPFAADTDYFAPAEQDFMINLVVDDLDRALEQVAEGGAELVGETEESEFGRFGWFLDPEGRKIELWQPPTPAPGEAGSDTR